MRDRPIRTRAALLAVASALAFASVPALADDADAPPPDPGVARISVVQGDVDVHRADADETYAAVVNAPVSEGDYVSTGDSSRGEIEFDYGTALRLAPDTQLRFTSLEPNHHALQLAQGTVEVRVFRGLGAHAEIQTPGASVRPTVNGSYRITVTDAGDTLVTVRSGRVDVGTSDGTRPLEAGPTLLLAGNADRPNVSTIEPVQLDAFDSFNHSRDVAVERAHDWAYVDAGFVGADDLDAYGTWSNVDGYGQVWQPTYVAAGWSPYSTGRWVWEPYYGWSWVDTAPWGYAPYHYGRWFYANANWYWSPGVTVAGPLYYSAPIAYYPRPVIYRPALVAFFSFGGGGGGGGLSIGFGNIGWCALAPSEPFQPWYGPGYGGGNSYARTTINVTNNYGNTYVNNGNITRTYRNINAPGGAVAVNNGNFANGNFSHIVTLRRSELATVTPVRGVVPVVPTASNLAFGSHRTLALGSGAPVATRFAHFTTTPHVAVASFAQQQRLVQSAAVKIYPEHATVLAHPEIVRKLDRPGLITNANVPEEFKATTNGAAAPKSYETGVPKSYETGVPKTTEIKPIPVTGTYGAKSATSTYGPTVSEPSNSPYSRFEHRMPISPATVEPQYKSGGNIPSVSRTPAPYRTTPPYMAPPNAPALVKPPATNVPTYAKPLPTYLKAQGTYHPPGWHPTPKPHPSTPAPKP